MEKQKPQLVPGQCFDHSAEDDERQLPVIPTGQAAPARLLLPNLGFKLLPSLQLWEVRHRVFKHLLTH